MQIISNNEQRIRELERAIAHHEIETEKHNLDIRTHHAAISQLNQQLTRAKNLYNQINGESYENRCLL